MKKILSIMAALALGFSLTACSTVEGIGKDLKKGGEAIEKAAKKT